MVYFSTSNYTAKYLSMLRYGLFYIYSLTTYFLSFAYFSTVSPTTRGTRQFSYKGDSADIAKLFLHLFEHKKWGLYVKPPGQTMVTISISLNGITDVDEFSQKISVSFLRQLQWNNTDLSWNPDEYGGMETIRVPISNVWTPDIAFINDISEQYKTVLNELSVSVTYYGHCTLLEPLIAKTICKLDISKYPFDQHQCKFTFGSWSLLRKDVYLHLFDYEGHTGADVENYIQHQTWQLDDFYGEEATRLEFRNIDGVPEEHSIVNYYIKFSRRWVLPFVYVVLPNIFISIMCVVSFLLPSESSEKVGFTVSLFIGMIVYLLLFYQLLPFTPNLPYIVQIVAVTTLGAMFTLLCNVCALIIFFKTTRDSQQEVPDWVRGRVLNQLGNFLGIFRAIIPLQERKQSLNVKVDILDVIPDEDDDLGHVQDTLPEDSGETSVNSKHPNSNKTNILVSNNSTLSRNNSEVINDAFDFNNKSNNAMVKQSEMEIKKTKLKEELRKSIWYGFESPEHMYSPVKRLKYTINSSKIKTNKDLLLYRSLKYMEYFNGNRIVDVRADKIRQEWVQVYLVFDRVMFFLYLFGMLFAWFILITAAYSS